METPNPTLPLNEAEAITEKVKEAVDTNSTDNPHLAIDHQNGKLAAVGDPNQIEVPDYKYEIEYEYPEDMIPDSEKSKYTYDNKSHTYKLKMTYENKRIKPIYRLKIIARLSALLIDMMILDKDGYSSDNLDDVIFEQTTINHIEDVIDLMVAILGITKEQAEYATSVSTMLFIYKLIKNEPNIVSACSDFLVQSATTSQKTEEKQ